LLVAAVVALVQVVEAVVEREGYSRLLLSH
jgi:hypothetical protein